MTKQLFLLLFIFSLGMAPNAQAARTPSLEAVTTNAASKIEFPSTPSGQLAREFISAINCDRDDAVRGL